MGASMHLLSRQLFTVWSVCLEIRTSCELLVSSGTISHLLWEMCQTFFSNNDVHSCFEDEQPELWRNHKTRDVKSALAHARTPVPADQERLVSGTLYLLSWSVQRCWYLVTMTNFISAILFRNQFQQQQYNQQDSLPPDIMDVAASPPVEFLPDL